MSKVEKFLKPLADAGSWLPTFTVLSYTMFVWAAVGLGPFSGFNTPLQFGDFEAQRHWMEITQHLHPYKWYFYDFDWWRLDYPPLTAFHSLLCGLAGSLINPKWFELDASRGMEEAGLKAFMRFTVIISQLLVYVPAVWYWTRTTTNSMTRTIEFGSLLLFPSLTIIDHGHFQYNSVMLGFAIASFASLVNRRYVSASILFMLALFFKQMALYYAPVIFMAILGQCLGPATQWKLKVNRLVAVGVTVVATAVLMLVPFINFEKLHHQEGLLQIVKRVFPLFRGLWEDKVANLWCTINYTMFKLKERFEPGQLQLLALAATLVGIAPGCVAAFEGQPQVWIWAFASCAWSFFLFSFQVHEKSVLVPLVPTLMTAVQHHNSSNVMAMAGWISNIGYFSMWPLLKREGLQLQYVTLFAMYNWLFTSKQVFWPRSWLNRLVVLASYSAFAAVALIEYFNSLPYILLLRYPDLFVVLNMTMSFGCFVYFWLWQSWYMLTLCISK